MSDQSGLQFQDLGQWQQWSQSTHRIERSLRDLKARIRPIPDTPGMLHLPSGEIRTLVVIDLLSPSCRYAICEPLMYMDHDHVAVLAPHGLEIPGEFARSHLWEGVDSLPSTVRAVLSLGAYLELSADVATWCEREDLPFFVIQHGLLTPVAPPVPRGARILAWTEADAEFWSGRRSDITSIVVGSQMLWAAGSAPKISASDERPIMLGQLHGVELSRQSTFTTYWNFCRRFPSDYRPHPNESDVVSRGLHEVMKRGGITFEISGESLVELARPVVSIFSTGTLEVAQRGLPAWVTHPRPEPWLRNFWNRYGLAEWGSDPTPPWPEPPIEPAAAVAAAVEAA